MDPSRNYNFHPHYNFTNQAQTPNLRPSNPNLPRPENAQNTGMPPNFGAQYPMPPNFGMQYPYNHPYMPFGFPPIPGNSYVPAPTNYPNTEPLNDTYTPDLSSASHDIPDFSTQISIGVVGGDTPTSFVAETQQSTKRGSYDFWSMEENKVLLTGYFHYSNDGELGTNQKGDTFWGKVHDFLNENSSSGKVRTLVQCKSHWRSMNKKICMFVGYLSAARREKRSGWNDENYIAKALETYQNAENARFTLLEEWKAFRHQPRYMTGDAESASSGSKRKSGSDSVESSMPSISRPEGRDATKKKARREGSRRKSKDVVGEELCKLIATRASFEQSLQEQNKNMAEYTRQRQVETMLSLSVLPERNDVQEAIYQDLRKTLGYN